MRRLTGLFVVAALAALAACGGVKQATPAASPTPTITTSASPAPRAEPWVFFERMDAKRVYEEGSSLGFFRRRLSDGKEERLAVAGTGRSWHVSSDGRMVAAVQETKTDRDLFVARAEGLSSMRKIDSPDHGVTSVLWAPSNETLFYVTFEPKDNGEPPRTGPERLYEIRQDGSGKRLVTTWEHPGEYTFHELLAYDAQASTIFWTQDAREGAGGYRDLYSTSTESGATRKVLEFNTTGNMRFSIRADGASAYYVEYQNQMRLIEARLADGTKRTIYETDGKTESGIESVHVTSDGARLMFQGTADPEFGNPIKTDRPKTTTYLVDLADGSRSVVLAETYQRNDKQTTRPSLDARYVWLYDSNIGAGGTTSLLEVATGRKSLVASSGGEKPVYARFIAWLSVPA